MTARIATLDDLLGRAGVGLEALAQAAAPDEREVDGERLGAALDAVRAASGEMPADETDVGVQAVRRLEAALADADAVVHGYLFSRYPEYFDETDPGRADPPAPVRRLLAVQAVDIALYRLLGGDEKSERRRLYEAAQGYLNRVSRHELDLTAASPGPLPETDAPGETIETALDTGGFQLPGPQS